MTNVVSRVAKSVYDYALAVVFAVLKIIQDRYTKMMFGYEKVTTKQSFYELVDKNMKKEDVPMSLFKGDVLLIVNVASQ